jgi:Holliday junction resolvasome RuvABC DNA-binding subunit
MSTCSEVEEEFGGASFEGNVEALVAMGFAKDAVEGTLRAVGNNMQVATESLLSSSSSS